MQEQIMEQHLRTVKCVHITSQTLWSPVEDLGRVPDGATFVFTMGSWEGRSLILTLCWDHRHNFAFCGETMKTGIISQRRVLFWHEWASYGVCDSGTVLTCWYFLRLTQGASVLWGALCWKDWVNGASFSFLEIDSKWKVLRKPCVGPSTL